MGNCSCGNLCSEITAAAISTGVPSAELGPEVMALVSVPCTTAGTDSGARIGWRLGLVYVLPKDLSLRGTLIAPWSSHSSSMTATGISSDRSEFELVHPCFLCEETFPEGNVKF